MLLFFILLYVVVLLSGLNLHDFLAELSGEFHKICLSRTNKSALYSDIFSALTCGARLKDPQWTATFKATGLLHLFVVSGAHLWWLENLMTKALPRSRWSTWVTLLLIPIFVLSCRISPPVTRAYFHILFQRGSKLSGWNLPGPWLCFYSGAACLCLAPHWIDSLSFQLSWAASLFLSAGGSSGLNKIVLLYLGLFPVLLPLGAPHPATILTSWLLTPIFLTLLFPLVILSSLLPSQSLLSWTEWTIGQFLTLNQWLGTTLSPADQFKFDFQHWIIWAYLLFTAVLMDWFHRKRHREIFN